MAARWWCRRIRGLPDGRGLRGGRTGWRLAVDVRLYPATQQTPGRTGKHPAGHDRPAAFPRMPELPEVETTRRGIAPHVVGRRIAKLHVYDPRLRWPVPADLGTRLVGRTIDGLDATQQVLTVSRRRGHAARPSRDDRQPPRVPAAARAPHRTTTSTSCSTTVRCFAITTRAGSARCCGSRARPRTIRCSRASGRSRSTPRSTRTTSGARRASRTAAIKLALMDNGLVVGVGNIYANEALFRAGIRPTTPAHRVSRPRLARLVDEVRAVLTEAIAKGGSTLRDYVDASGRAGLFPARLLRVRPRRRAVPRLRHRDPAPAAGRAGVVLLPGLPAVAAQPARCPIQGTGRRWPAARDGAEPRVAARRRRSLCAPASARRSAWVVLHS